MTLSHLHFLFIQAVKGKNHDDVFRLNVYSRYVPDSSLKKAKGC